MLVLAACAPGATTGDGLTIFAAASLRTVTDDLETAWSALEPDVPLTFATGASNVLATQIREGASADVFISADDVEPRRLAEDGLTAGEPVVLARNEITLVTRPGGPVTAPADLALPGVTIVVGGPDTPSGRYATEAMRELAALMPEPDAFSAAVEGNVASHEDNVRAALAKVELGEGDAAFVYRTDARGSAATTEIALPAEARVGALYSAVQLSDDPGAGRFFDWLGSTAVTTILVEAGFELAP